MESAEWRKKNNNEYDWMFFVVIGIGRFFCPMRKLTPSFTVVKLSPFLPYKVISYVFALYGTVLSPFPQDATVPTQGSFI